MTPIAEHKIAKHEARNEISHLQQLYKVQLNPGSTNEVALLFHDEFFGMQYHILKINQSRIGRTSKFELPIATSIDNLQVNAYFSQYNVYKA